MAGTGEPQPVGGVDSLSFEEAYRRLGEMAESLENGGLTLAEATARYEEGIRLLRRCNQLLDEAELKIRTLKDEYVTPSRDESDAGASAVDDLPF